MGNKRLRFGIVRDYVTSKKLKVTYSKAKFITQEHVAWSVKSVRPPPTNSDYKGYRPIQNLHDLGQRRSNSKRPSSARNLGPCRDMLSTKALSELQC